MNPAFTTLLMIAGGVISGTMVQLFVDWRRERRKEKTLGLKLVELTGTVSRNKHDLSNKIEMNTKDIEAFSADMEDMQDMVYRIKGAVEASTGITIGNGINYRTGTGRKE